MNVSVPESMRDWVQSRIESGEYASVSDYVRDLIRRDQNALARQLKVEDIPGQSRRAERWAGP
jgi:antitoxin ParD1/3/4